MNFFLILVPPAIEETERVLTFNQNDVAELPCSSDGFPPPKISWIRQGRAHLETGGKHELRRSGNLVITGVQVID
jgi:Immunoglobulin domain